MISKLPAMAVRFVKADKLCKTLFSLIVKFPPIEDRFSKPDKLSIPTSSVRLRKIYYA